MVDSVTIIRRDGFFFLNTTRGTYVAVEFNGQNPNGGDVFDNFEPIIIPLESDGSFGVLLGSGLLNELGK